MTNGRYIPEEIIQNTEIILSGNDPEKFIKLAKKMGEYCARNVTTSQIRSIFNRVKRMPNAFDKVKRELQLLRPKLAYQKGRHPKMKGLQEVLDNLIQKVDSDNTLENFKDFFEAIIAYHKASGGKE